MYPRKQEAAQSTNKYNTQQQQTTEVNSKLNKAQTLVFRICMKNYNSNNKQKEEEVVVVVGSSGNHHRYM